jgi:hypothetical protein
VVLFLAGCDGVVRRGDTTAVQTLGRWEWNARLRLDVDPVLTLARLSIDTGTVPGRDVVLVRYEVNPTAALGDEYAVTVGLELGNVRNLRPGARNQIGSAPAALRAHATVTCLCPPLREDSLRGTFTLATRGMRQLVGRLDATFYFTEWNNPERHRTYALHQRLDAIK